MPKKTPSINYTSRDFNSIKNDLLEYARRYYPETYKDFSEPSFGSLMMDTVAYVGDTLSFYLDYQANESFLATALEYNNILKMTKFLGYKYQPVQSAFGLLQFYVLVPADSTAVAPQKTYMPILKMGSTFKSLSGNAYTLIEDVDFSKSTNDIIVAEVNSQTGAPTHYAIKASGQVVSGDLFVQRISVGSYQPFQRFRLNGSNITEVVSVVDGNGNEYYEVDYLAQNLIYVPVINTDTNKETVPNVLKAVSVARRFIVDQDPTGVYLQFGFGSNETPVELTKPSDVTLKLHGKNYTTDQSFDPSILNETDELGVSPSDTILTVVYRVNSNASLNAGAKTITGVANAQFQFTDPESLSVGTRNGVINSLEVSNEKAINGSVAMPSSTELKLRAHSAYASQHRAVTSQDYVSTVYRMPAKFGAVKRCSISQDADSFNYRNLNLYVASENNDGTLSATNNTIKNNLKTWLNQYKMINDTIDILDARIVNLGINFSVTAFPGTNKFTALDQASRNLRTALNKSYDIGEPFMITDVYSILKNSNAVLDVTDVNIVLKTGGLHSNSSFDILGNTVPDGTMIIAPADTIFEIKYPNSDIKGTIN